MRLSELLKNVYPLPSQQDCDVESLFLDSRKVSPQGLFFALQGAGSHGSQYIDDAIRNGAIAVLIDKEPVENSFHTSIPIIVIPKLADHLPALAARFYTYPTKVLRMIGVTGTSGKTSCTHFIAQSLQSLNVPCGLIGTLGNGFFNELNEVGLTTPDAIQLQMICKKLLNSGAKAIAMEVSSHSIAQKRIQTIEFEIGIFTNLSQDHLDYHGTMGNYAEVKKQFLIQPETKQVILNLDDLYAQEWITSLVSHKNIFAFSLQKPPQFLSQVEYIYCEKIHYGNETIHAVIQSPWGKGELNLSLVGQFNLSNALASLSALCVYGIPLSQSLLELSKLIPVPGRMQKIFKPNAPLVVVDYAHKPDALEKVLLTLRNSVPGKLICVFGCGGERDRSKRPLMGEIAERLADYVIVTNDNPRHENPMAIIKEISQGFLSHDKVLIEPDRSKAIEKSIHYANSGDCVLIAGKGAEVYQQIGDQKIPFSDVDQAKIVIEKKSLTGAL